MASERRKVWEGIFTGPDAARDRSVGMEATAWQLAQRRALRRAAVLIVVNSLLGSVLVVLDGQNWVVSGPLFTVVGAVAFCLLCLVGWGLSLVLYVFTGNAEPVGQLWPAAWSGGPEPFRSALGLLLVGVVGAWGWWRYGGSVALIEENGTLFVSGLAVVGLLLCAGGGIWFWKCWLPAH